MVAIVADAGVVVICKDRLTINGGGSVRSVRRVGCGTGWAGVIGHAILNNGRGRRCGRGCGFGGTGNSRNVGSRGRGISSLEGASRFTKGSTLGLLGILECLSCHFTTGMDAKVGEMICAIAMCTEEITSFPGFPNGRECFGL